MSNQTAKGLADDVIAERFTSNRREEWLRGTVMGSRAEVFNTAPQVFPCARMQHDDSVLAELRVVDHQIRRVRVQVSLCGLQSKSLADTQAGTGEQPKQRR